MLKFPLMTIHDFPSSSTSFSKVGYFVYIIVRHSELEF